MFPVKGCMFFGVPHKGADVAATASRFLSLLGHVFNVNKKQIQDLKPKSQRFANISSQFRAVQSEHNIPVISFFETVKYNHTIGLVSWTSTSFGRVPVAIRALARNCPFDLSFCCNAVGFHIINMRVLVPCYNVHLGFHTSLFGLSHSNVPSIMFSLILRR